MQENPHHGQSTRLPEFLTCDDVATRLQLTPKTVRKLVKLGREGDPTGIRSVKVGKSIRIVASELVRLAEAAS